jgi:hypothetical protein
MSLTMEKALLVACARARLEPDDAAQVRRLAADVRDWPAVLDLARRHRMLPMLHTHVSAVADDLVPAQTLAELRQQFAANAAKSLTLAMEVLAITELFDRESVRAIPYKGPTLAQCVYGSLAARQMKDLDVLIRRDDFDRAVSLLADRGFQLVARPWSALRRLGLEYQAVLTRASDSMVIELHWTIVPRAIAPPIGVDDLWPNLLRTSMLGRSIPSPSHEDTLVILCVHGAKHQWARLEWITGVAELVRSKPVDWLAVLARAERWHATRMLGTGLILAADLLGAPVPDAVLADARVDAEVVALASIAAGCLFADGERLVARRAVRAFQLRVQEGVRDKARYLWFRPLIDGARKGARAARMLEAWVAR